MRRCKRTLDAAAAEISPRASIQYAFLIAKSWVTSPLSPLRLSGRQFNWLFLIALSWVTLPLSFVCLSPSRLLLGSNFARGHPTLGDQKSLLN